MRSQLLVNHPFRKALAFINALVKAHFDYRDFDGTIMVTTDIILNTSLTLSMPPTISILEVSTKHCTTSQRLY